MNDKALLAEIYKTINDEIRKYKEAEGFGSIPRLQYSRKILEIFKKHNYQG